MPYTNVSKEATLSSTYSRRYNGSLTTTKTINAGAVFSSLSRSGTNRNTKLLGTNTIPQSRPTLTKRVWVFVGRRAVIVGFRKDGSPIFRRKKVYEMRLKQVFLRKAKNGKKKVPLVFPHPNDLKTVWRKMKSDSRGKVFIASQNVISPGYTASLTADVAGYSSLPFSWKPSGGTPDPSNWGRVDPSAWVNSVESDMLSNLRAKVKGQSVNLQNSLAESRQMIDMIRQLFIRLVQTLIAAKHGNLLGAFTHLFPNSAKELSNDYLVWQFGIRPLVSDLDGILKSIASSGIQPVFDVNVTRSNKGGGTFNQKSNYGLSFSAYNQVEWEVNVRYKARVEVILPHTKDLAVLGFTNPAATLWEVTPWSFLIDWLLPIGKYLDQLDWSSGCRVVHVTKTVLYKHKFSGMLGVNGRDTDGFVWDPETIIWEGSDGFCTRAMLDNAAIDKVPFPSIRSPFSVTHLLETLALLIQRNK